MSRLIPGLPIRYQNQDYIILDIPSLDRVIIRHATTGQTEQVSPNDLNASPLSSTPTHSHFLMVADEDWREAWERYELIRPLLARPSRDRSVEEIQGIAKIANTSIPSVYRWIARFEQTGTVSSLLRRKRKDTGKTRLSADQEALLQVVINEFYLTRERASMMETWEELYLRSQEKNIPVPHFNTLRHRITLIDESLQVTKRISPKVAREKFTPLRGSFPNADFPLAVVQIDHTPVDLILVDETHRQPIGRGFLTLAIDVCTRMVAGFYISLDPAGALSTGLCLAQAILPKEKSLARFDIATPWPIWGLPRKIHADNASEFRGTMLERACNEYGIIIENRPKKQPQYGGHIERSFRTFMSRTQRLPGTTFSNTQTKGDYNSEGKATMTLSEFEHWFTIFLVQVYHHKKHDGIDNVPPIKRYEQHILGSAEQPGIGLPERIQNEEKLRLDFMPFVKRTIQEYGIVIDNITYYSDILRHWIHARDSQNIKLKRKFIFARDPRDISVVYFLHPETHLYTAIPYRNSKHPPMSLWELNAILKKVAEDPSLQPDEEIIFDGLRKMREVERLSMEKSKSAKRQKARRTGWQKALKGTESPVLIDDYPAGDILPFDIQESQ